MEATKCGLGGVEIFAEKIYCLGGRLDYLKESCRVGSAWAVELMFKVKEISVLGAA